MNNSLSSTRGDLSFILLRETNPSPLDLYRLLTEKIILTTAKEVEGERFKAIEESSENEAIHFLIDMGKLLEKTKEKKRLEEIENLIYLKGIDRQFFFISSAL